MPKIDAPVTTSGTPVEKRWVEVPDKDQFDITFPTIRVNFQEFPPGRHYLESNLADTVERLVKNKVRADIRVMSPKKDFASEDLMNKFGVGSGMGRAAQNLESMQ